MRAYVFTDEALVRQAGRFVWLRMDAEKAENATFVEKLEVEGYPTLFVVDPRTEAVALRWLGAVTVPQLERLLADGERAVKGGGTGLDARLAEVDRVYGQGDLARSADLLRPLLKDAPPSWPPRPRAVETALFALTGLKRWDDCLALAGSEGPGLRETPSFANVASLASSCALELPKDSAARPAAVATYEGWVRDALASKVQIAADDRSALYGSLIDAREDASDAEGAQRLAGEWATFVEGEAARAGTPQQRAVFDAHRLTAYLALHQPERAIPMLQQSERELPDDYNPPARLAVAYRKAGRYAESLAASGRALVKAYGPRKLRVYSDRVETCVAMGDPQAARTTLEEAISYAKSLPAPQRSEKAVSALEKRLASLQAPSPSP